MRPDSIFSSLGMILGTTIGAGIFALPFVFYVAGWITSLFYLAILTAVVIFVHYLYLKVLNVTGQSGDLLSLSKKYFGKKGFYAGSVAILGGLAFALVVYLILGTEFLILIFPKLDYASALLFFWLICSLPILFRREIFLDLEMLGALFMFVLIILVFMQGGGLNLERITLFNSSQMLIPFSIILFSLAGWTAVGPLSWILKSGASSYKKILVLALGTALVSILYLLFIIGILNSAQTITPNAVSGLVNWSYGQILIIALLGLFAIWTSYLPVAFEIKNSLKDWRIKGKIATLLIIVFPILTVVLGLKNFLVAMSIAGGLFLSLQYALILLVSRRALKPKLFTKFWIYLIMVLFVLAAAYEIAFFALQLS